MKHMHNKNRNQIATFFLLNIFSLLILGYFILIQFKNMHLTASEISHLTSQSNKKVLINNKSFFPFGFYYVDLGMTQDNMYVKKKEMLKNIKNTGFNTVHFSITHNLNGFKNLMNEAQKLGIYVLLEHQANFEKKESIMAFKRHPALLAWNIGDDVNLHFRPAQILSYRKQIKDFGSNKLTYISMFDPRIEVIKRYIHTSDLVGMQSYPISNRPLQSTFSEIKAAVTVSKEENGSPVIANLQAFKSSLPDDLGRLQRQPTFPEVRNMTYQALLAGAKGIIYYTYRDQSWYLPEHRKLWEGLKSIASEIKILSPILLDGNLQEVNTRINNILAGIWIYKNQTIAIVINTSDIHKNQVEIAMPDGVKKAQTMFNNNSSSMLINNNKLSGIIQPLEVHIYRLQS